MRFLFSTDQKCTESSTYWQLFYYRPHGTFRYIAGEIVEMGCQELDICIYIYIILSIIDVDFLHQFNLRLHDFPQFFYVIKNGFQNFQKLAGLWLVGEVVISNHHDRVGIYGSKVAEGCSAFQRRSYFRTVVLRSIHMYLSKNCTIALSHAQFSKTVTDTNSNYSQFEKGYIIPEDTHCYHITLFGL